jgi:hypothetical protein
MPRVTWYAATDHIIRMGPYRSQAAAWAALVLTDDEQRKQRSVHPRSARVWPETT